MPVHDRSSFENLYAGHPRWEIGRPHKAFLDMADQITGSILDSGCGTGEIALHFASRGHKVTGIDFLSEPITIAIQTAAERGVTATFLVMDALALKGWSERFHNIIDSGLFHVYTLLTLQQPSFQHWPWKSVYRLHVRGVGPRYSRALRESLFGTHGRGDREVDRFIRQHTLEKFGPVRSVTPVLVFELAFENIQMSKRHKSGIAVRFPRIPHFRQ